MEKKKKYKLVLLAIVVIAVYFANFSTNSDKLSSLTLANTEALASENGKAEFWCCGNISTCAKGDGIEIVGHLQRLPCNN